MNKRRKMLTFLLILILSLSSFSTYGAAVGAIGFGEFLQLLLGGTIASGEISEHQGDLTELDGGVLQSLSSDEMSFMLKEIAKYKLFGLENPNGSSVTCTDDLIKLGMSSRNANLLYDCYLEFLKGQTLSECVNGKESILNEMLSLSKIEVLTDYYSQGGIALEDGTVGMLNDVYLYQQMESKMGLYSNYFSRYMMGNSVSVGPCSISLDMDTYKSYFNRWIGGSKQLGLTYYYVVTTSAYFTGSYGGTTNYSSLYNPCYKFLYNSYGDYKILPQVIWVASSSPITVSNKYLNSGQFYGVEIGCDSSWSYFIPQGRVTGTDYVADVGDSVSFLNSGTIRVLSGSYALNIASSSVALSDVCTSVSPEVAKVSPVIIPNVITKDTVIEHGGSLTLDEIMELIGSQDMVLDGVVAQDLEQDITLAPDFVLDNSDVIGAINSNTDKILSSPSGSIDLSPLYISLEDKFPFCIPFDLYNSVKSFQEDKEPFVLTIDLSETGSPVFAQAEPIQFDFSQFEGFISVFRYMMFFSFLIWLIVLTRKIVS